MMKTPVNPLIAHHRGHAQASQGRRSVLGHLPEVTRALPHRSLWFQAGSAAESTTRSKRGDMDVFKIHEQLIDDYRAFTSGSVEVRDRRIRAHVDQQLSEGHQWPDP